MQTIVTHSGSFDPDDVLAIAALQLYLNDEEVKVIRSRDKKVIREADWVVDVGEVYDVSKNRFDHHQNGMSARDNGVPYSSFGLIWKEFGASICGSEQIASHIEEQLAQPIDAADNHVTVCQPNQPGVTPFEFFDVIDSFKPVWGSEEDYDTQFLVAVEFACGMLTRIIAQEKAKVVMLEMVEDKYEKSERKAVLVFDDLIPRHALVGFEDVRAIVTPVPSKDSDYWLAAVVPVFRHGFQNRAVFPDDWAGLSDGELEKVSGIEGAVFCHKERYVFVSETKEGAVKAANYAL